MRPGSDDINGAVAALPLAAALTLILARWLPVRFSYQPNDLGIVSAASVAHYPIQQEAFWAAFGLGGGALLAWLLARALHPASGAIGRIVAVEALAVGALLSALWLPQVAAELAVATACLAAVAVARRAGRVSPATGAVGPQAADSTATAHRRSSTAIWVAVALLAAPLLTSSLGIHLYNVANHISDARIAVDNFKFLGETGQHLAWANALSHGWFQGRDVFCLYGPLYDLGLVGFWSLVGRSVAAWNLYWALTRAVAWVALFLLAGALVRHRAAVLVVPFLLPWIELRVGWALFAALLLYRWLTTDRRRWCAASGALAGVAVLYSQEYGTAICVAALIAFAVRRDWRSLLFFGVSAVVAMTPLLAYYGAHDALLPMLRDVAQYPSYMIAGYGKLPFAAIVPSLPFSVDWADLASRASETVRLSYAVPAVCLAGLLLALPMTSIDPRRPLQSLRAIADGLARDPVRLMWVLVAVFGLIAFRSAMGRSSLHRTHAALPAVALLLCVATDRCIALWHRAPRLRVLAAWRISALVLFVAIGGFFQTASPIASAGKSLRLASNLVRHGHHPKADPHILRVTRWVQHHTEPAEPVLFLPNDAAYYYLTDRPNPIRFVMGHQIVSDRHRAEVLTDLRRSPPRYILWDHHALRVDDLSDELVFGREILAFIEDHYATETRLGEVEILRHRERAEPELVPGW